MNLIKYYIIIITILFSCNKKPNTEKFTIPIKVDYISEDFNFYNFEDSILKNYSSSHSLTSKFKTLSNYNLNDYYSELKRLEFTPYNDSETFEVSFLKNEKGKLISIGFFAFKHQFPKIIKKDKSEILTNNLQYISENEAYNFYDSIIKTQPFFNNKENLDNTFLILVEAFNKKYGTYNFKIINSLTNKYYNQTKYNWLVDGVLISIEKIKTNFEEKINPYNEHFSLNKRDFELNKISKYHYIDSEYYINSSYTDILISFNDINGKFNYFNYLDEIERNKEIENRKNDSLKKVKIDSTKKNNVNKILNEL